MNEDGGAQSPARAYPGHENAARASEAPRLHVTPPEEEEMSATQSIDLSTTDPRVQKGCVLASQSAQWIRGHTCAGTPVWGIPSQRLAGVYHLTSRTRCSCRDFLYRDPEPCKHVIAVHVAELSRTYRELAARWFGDES